MPATLPPTSYHESTCFVARSLLHVPRPLFFGTALYLGLRLISLSMMVYARLEPNCLASAGLLITYVHE